MIDMRSFAPSGLRFQIKHRGDFIAIARHLQQSSRDRFNRSRFPSFIAFCNIRLTLKNSEPSRLSYA